MLTVNICEEFSETPGARYKSDGRFSGEEFRESLLLPRYEEARRRKDKLQILFDGGYGYPTSFLEEAFGGLARIFPQKEILDTLLLISNDEPSLVEEVIDYIKKSEKKTNEE